MSARYSTSPSVVDGVVAPSTSLPIQVIHQRIRLSRGDYYDCLCSSRTRVHVTLSMGVEHWVQPGAHVLQQAVIFFKTRAGYMYACLFTLWYHVHYPSKVVLLD